MVVTADNFDPVAYNFYAWAGCAIAMTFSNFGTAYGTAKSGMGIASLSVTRPHLAFKSIIPIIMAGILSIYGLIISVLLAQKITTTTDTACKPMNYMGAGLVSGFSNVFAGYAIGVVGE